MATSSISSLGIGSGLDVNGIISSLVSLETRPLTKLTREEAVLQAKLSGIGQLRSMVSGFNDALKTLMAPNAFAGTTANSSDSGAVSASSTPGTAPGSYAVTVSALASTQTLVSTAGQFANASANVGTGSLTVRLGTWTPGAPPTFAPKTGSSDIVIPIGATEGTLAGIRDKINAANAGVTAAIVTDATGARLSLRSNTPGAESGVRISVVDDDTANGDAAGLSRLAYDPQIGIGTTTGTGAGSMALAQAASNTRATINGIEISSASDTVTDAIAGVTLKLGRITTTPVTVNVGTDTGSVKGMLQKLATAYNELSGYIAEQTRYDAANKTGALFQGDSGMLGVQSQLRALVGQASGASSTFATLSSIGLELQKDGSLKVNNSKLDAATKNLPEMGKALANPASGVGGAGIATRLRDWAESLSAATGMLPARSKAIQRSITENGKDRERVNARIESIEKRLRAQYGALDSTMANANALSKFVGQQITNWNKSTG